MNDFATNDRGVSQVVGYVLGLGVITILITSLLIGVSGFLETETQRAQEQAFEVIGQQVAADIEATDAYVLETGGDNTITRTTEVPARIAASDYRIEITAQGGGLYQMRIYNTNGVSVPVLLRSYTPLEETTISGGDVRITYDPSQGEVVFNE